MKKFEIQEIKNLITEAITQKTSGHPFLDQRWQTEGENIDGRGCRNSHYRRSYYRFNQLLAKTYEPEVVVELGIDEGDSVAHFANGCSRSKIYGVDIHKDWEYPATRCKEVEKAFPNFTYVRGWTWDKVQDIRNLNKPIDILFIDSWHEPDYLIRDWNDYHKLLRKGSLVLVDDLQIFGLIDIFNKFNGEKFIDSTMNSACPIGIMVYDGTILDLPYNKKEYMS